MATGTIKKSSVSYPISIANGGTGATSASAARTKLLIKGGSNVLTFSSGSATASFSDFGLTGRPTIMVVSPESWDGIIRYDYDASTSNLVFYAYILANGGASMSSVNAAVRFGWVAFGV